MRDPIQDIAWQLGIRTFGDGLLTKIRETIDLLQSDANNLMQYKEVAAELETEHAELVSDMQKTMAEVIEDLHTELAEVKAELALALKVPSIAAMHTWLDSDCAKQNKQLEAELAALKAKAAVPEIVPQWGKSLSHCWPKCEASKEGDWCVGHISEDGDFYDVLTVEASQYDADGESQKIAEAIVALWAFAEAAPAQPQNDAVIELLRQVADPHKWAISMCDTAADLLTLLGGEA